VNILIVDDEIDQLETLRRGLRSRGYEVREATSAEEGLNILHSQSSEIDLVLTDYWMRGINGLQFLQAIRQRFGNFPVIMMSGYIQKSTLDSALNHDCDCFLEKPFTLERLTAEIDRALHYHALPVHRNDDCFEDTKKNSMADGKGRRNVR